MRQWMCSLFDYGMISGEPGKEGSTMNMKFKRGKGEMEMVQTIIKRNTSEEFNAIYDTKGVHKIQRNYFKAKNGKTKWISESEFQCTGLEMKLIGFLMPGAFKKQSMKYAQDFKNFAEKRISVTNS